jgi:hypothetical protein
LLCCAINALSALSALGALAVDEPGRGGRYVIAIQLNGREVTRRVITVR